MLTAAATRIQAAMMKTEEYNIVFLLPNLDDKASESKLPGNAPSR